MDWKKFKLFLTHASKLTKRSKISLVFDAISCVFKYNISLLEYFQFRFFELNEEQQDDVLQLIDKFEEDDDVLAVYHNLK